jgi:tetratricopeptide (TPR) repeat protein
VTSHTSDALLALLSESPREGFRAFFKLEERLLEEGRADEARALAEDLWRRLGATPPSAPPERARLAHDFAVFLGTPGPAADLARARRLFAEARAFWEEAGEAADAARSLHNEANALQNLAAGAAELEEALVLYERALLFRTAERAIARGVTLHNMGAALRKLGELSKDAALLSRSVEALREAVAIRRGEGLAEGEALSRFQLGLTLQAAGEADAAREAFQESARLYEALGKPGEAEVARRCAV